MRRASHDVLRITVRRAVRWVAHVTEGPRLEFRATWAGRRVRPILQRGDPRKAAVVLVSVMRDDGPRLRFWIDYYRAMGVGHIVVIDNGSMDSSRELLAELDEITIFDAPGSFRSARYGVDWVNAVLRRLRVHDWVLWADTDEFLAFDGSGTRGLPELTRFLQRSGARSLQCLLLDVYSDRPVRENRVADGENPFGVCDWYDRNGYVRKLDPRTSTTWIKGGVRGRTFFSGVEENSPALNKTPLVRWSRRSRFVQVAHRLRPAHLNDSSLVSGISGVLLHQKFVESVAVKAVDLAHVAQHDPEYRRYDSFADASPVMPDLSRRLTDVRQLIEEGLMSEIPWPDEGPAPTAWSNRPLLRSNASAARGSPP